MGAIEELGDDDVGICPICQKTAETKCTACKKVFYCSKECQKKHWKTHKFDCKSLPYRICQSPELGRYLVAARDLAEGEVLFTEAPLVVGPIAITPPVCLNCYNLVDGSYKCRKSGWPLCGPRCEKAVQGNPEIVIPHQTEATFEIDNYGEACYLYECISPLRALLLQKTAPSKYKKLMSLESHLELRRGKEEWKHCQENVIDVMKKTLGVMVFEVLYPQLNFTDENIQKIVGIFETNAIEIRLAQASDISALYEVACLMEHSCIPNVKFNFDDKYNITARTGRAIKKGENLSIMYTHSMWGTAARRDHLYSVKRFWCTCPRCKDPTEFGTHFSTLIRNGKLMVQKNPLDPECPWESEDGSEILSSDAVAAEMASIGAELSVLQIKGSVEDYEEFIAKYEDKELHPNHYHLATAKHSLMQMLGRNEGYLIQDLPMNLLRRKEQLCRDQIKLAERLDPCFARLQVYTAAAYFELHLPLLQYGKRKWETGEFPTEEFRDTLFEPRDLLRKAAELLKEETNDLLPEGQLRILVKDTLTQLEQFMKTIGCEF